MSQAVNKGRRLNWTDVRTLESSVNYHVAQVQPACYIIALDLNRIEEERLDQIPLIMRLDRSPPLDLHVFDTIEVRSYRQVVIEGKLTNL